MTPLGTLEHTVSTLTERVSARGREARLIDLAVVTDSSIREMVEGPNISVVFDSSDNQSTEPESTLHERLTALGVTSEFVGMGRDEDGYRRAVAICRGIAPPRLARAPDTFRAIAIIPVFNEEDIIESTMAHLIANGLGVYVVDNWSTDRTLELVLSFEGRGLIGHERFPEERAPDAYHLLALNERFEQLAESLDADWIVSNDADEFRSAPWTGVSLRDALYHVHQAGFSAVNYTSLNFALTSDSYAPGSEIADHLMWFGIEPGSLHRLNTWRKVPGVPAELAWSGGHTVRFPGLSVFPYNFLIRHYPMRSVEQAQRKVFAERLPRFPVEERLRGWHSHYDHLRVRDLLQPTEGLYRYGPRFDEEFLLERLTGLPAGPVQRQRSLKSTAIEVLRRSRLLEHVLRVHWRIAGRAAK